MLTHSLSGTQYSVAFTRYCVGLTILVTENIPSEIVRYLSLSLGSHNAPESDLHIVSGTS